jgi:hypothetical protein
MDTEERGGVGIEVGRDASGQTLEVVAVEGAAVVERAEGVLGAGLE